MSKIEQERIDRTYRNYICDTLYFQGENKRITMRFKDALKPQVIDTRSGDEIAADIISRLGLRTTQ